MKTTIDLPSDLVRAFKLRAARNGRKLNTTAVAIFRAQLEQREETRRAPKSTLKTLPLLKARPLSKARVKRMSARQMSDFIKEAEQETEIERHEKAFGH
jgi:plasmid stability protein